MELLPILLGLLAVSALEVPLWHSQAASDYKLNAQGQSSANLTSFRTVNLGRSSISAISTSALLLESSLLPSARVQPGLGSMMFPAKGEDLRWSGVVHTIPHCPPLLNPKTRHLAWTLALVLGY